MGGGGGAARRVLVAVDDKNGIGWGRILGDVGTDCDEAGGAGDRRVVAEGGRCGSFGGGDFCLAIAFSQSLAIELALVGLMAGVVDTFSNDSPRLVESLSSPFTLSCFWDGAGSFEVGAEVTGPGDPPSDDKDTE
jgi:hypothetical protein